MTIDGPNATTLEGIESIWGELNKEGEKLTGAFLGDFVNGNLQNELLRKKKRIRKSGL
ncbi:MAG: hypothetical protein Ta2B_20440 [Termitinemataceae bacterium]|nr:MAG: hypothetical protein Ta2B_20440 [Termitinemataceae bacterium]